MTEAPGQDLLDVLASDHEAMVELLDRLHPAEIEAATAPPESQRQQLVIDVVRHLVAEEQYLWPLVRHRLDGGDQLAETAFADDREIEHALRGLEHPDADAQYLGVVLAGVQRLLAEHVREQAEQLFPQLRATVEADELVRLADEAVGAEQVGPTRPRLLHPENAALNKASGLVEGFIDHVRDTYRHRGARAEEIE